MLAALPTVIDEEPKSWEAKARCRDGSGALTHLFFSEELQDIARAKRICAECPVIEPCLVRRARAARAVGRLGRAADPQRSDPGQQAAPGSSAQACRGPRTSSR